MYVTGHGVQQDYSAAALWFRKAAEQGYVLAQTNLGVIYRDGRGATRDETEAEARTRLEAGYTTTFSLENFIGISQRCANRQHRASV